MKLIIIAGPNGAGKTTIAELLLTEIGINEFVNVDQIARGLSMFQPDRMAFQAGRIALDRINQLLKEHRDFAIETTLSSQSILNLIRREKKIGYTVILNFHALPNEETALKRVQHRVELGGHDIPVKTIRRRFERGLKLLFCVIHNEVDRWYFYQNLEKAELAAYKNKNVAVLKELYNEYRNKYIGR